MARTMQQNETMSIAFLLGVLSVGWTAYELGRMSREKPRVRAWDRHGQPLDIQVVN